MNIAQGGDIGGNGHAGMRNLQGFQLCLPNSRQARIVVTTITEGSQLHIIEGQFGIVPNAAPTGDECLHLFMIQHSFTIVALALVPECTFDRVRQERVNHSIIQSERALMINAITTLGWELVQFVSKICLQGRYTFETYRRNPRLDARASPVTTDETNGHIQFLLQMPAKIVTHRREVGHDLGRAGLPTTRFYIALRSSTRDMRNLNMTNQRMVAVGNLFLGIGRATHRPLHVGLAGAKPNFAHEHIV